MGNRKLHNCISCLIKISRKSKLLGRFFCFLSLLSCLFCFRSFSLLSFSFLGLFLSSFSFLSRSLLFLSLILKVFIFLIQCGFLLSFVFVGLMRKCKTIQRIL